MGEGAQLYQKLIDVLATNDLKQVKSFLANIENPARLEKMSFYTVSALLQDIEEYTSWLNSQDPRGLAGSGKGAKKKDILIICRRLCKQLKGKKEERRQEEMRSLQDYREKYRNFLPRSITANMDHGPPSTKSNKRKEGAR
jgi:hypothetical protein